MPCQEGDANWEMEDAELIQRTRSQLQPLRWFQPHQVLEGKVLRLRHAYPVLEKATESKVERICAYLRSFANLAQCGRNATFLHSSIHDVIRQGKEAIDSFATPACSIRSDA